MSESYEAEERAHAKINLLLHVFEGASSGYHALETLFQRLALHDVVRVGVNRGSDEMCISGPALPQAGLGPRESNLAWRAAAAFRLSTGWPHSWQICIEKNIPVGGGLGGGSSDAGAVLRALNRLAPEPLSAAGLLAIAGSLGADVPFLTSQASLAWAWGRGERMLELPPVASMPVDLVIFDEGVSTAHAYQALDTLRAASSQEVDGGVAVAMSSKKNAESQTNPGSLVSPISPVVPAFMYARNTFSSWESIAALARNDFEAVVPGLHSGVAAALPSIKAAASEYRSSGHISFALLSGSGASCFLLRPDGHDAALHLPPGSRLVTTSTV